MCNKAIIKNVLQYNSKMYMQLIIQYSNGLRNINQSYFNLPYFQGVAGITRRSYCHNHKKFNMSLYYKQILMTPMLSTNLLNSNELIGVRYYSSKKENNLPKLMDFPQVVWPSVFKGVRNWILSNFIIIRYFDSEFSLPEFVLASKQAVELVSGIISKGDVDSLPGLVTPDVIKLVQDSLNKFTLKQRQEFGIRSEDIYFCFPYQVGIMFPNEDRNEGENQSRFVEITMCYHALHGFKEMKEAGVTLPVNLGAIPEYQEKLFICNYRFIREFTKGVQDDWTINAINHFKYATALN